MREFKREMRQEFRNNPGSRKVFNKALREGGDPTEAFEQGGPIDQRFNQFKDENVNQEDNRGPVELDENFRPKPNDKKPQRSKGELKEENSQNQNDNKNENSGVSEDDEEKKIK